MKIRELGVLPEKKETTKGCLPYGEPIIYDKEAAGFNQALDIVGEVEVGLDRQKIFKILTNNLFIDENNRGEKRICGIFRSAKTLIAAESSLIKRK